MDSLTDLIGVVAVAAIAFAAIELIRSWQIKRARQAIQLAEFGKHRRSAEMTSSAEPLQIELTNDAGETFVLPLRPDDERSIRSFLRQAETVRGG